MVKILAVSGLIVAGITITIFMAPSGPCDPVKNIKIPSLRSPRGDGITKSPLDWVRDIKCSLTDMSGSSEKTQASPSAFLTPSVDSRDSAPSSSLSAIFRFNSRDESRATELKLEMFVYKDYPVKKFNPYLPIEVVLETGGKIVWRGVVTAGDCHDEEKVPFCEVKSYVNNRQWWKDGLKMRAYDVDGKRGAYLDYKIGK